ncbi:MAG: hypothetical protein AAF921_28830, partial [Cyanobacteria bacterium P01_D01_bin.44]
MGLPPGQGETPPYNPAYSRPLWEGTVKKKGILCGHLTYLPTVYIYLSDLTAEKLVLFLTFYVIRIVVFAFNFVFKASQR